VTFTNSGLIVTLAARLRLPALYPSARWPRAAVQVLDRPSDHGATRNLLLDCYLEGWAEPDLAKILAAATRDYRFHDPFIGSFSRWSLHEYFDRVQNGLSRLGVIGLQDMAFFLRGPMDARSKELQFWREAPRIGLTGVAWMEIGELGVSAERVAYDLNMAPFEFRAGTRPELRIPGDAAQTRMVSVAGIRPDSRKSARPFKGIIFPDVSEFESYMPSQAVPCWPGQNAVRAGGCFNTAACRQAADYYS
jgi:hypothetical protein